MEYITVNEIAEKWGISARRVRAFIADGKINGVVKKGRAYLIPTDTVKPMDGRAYNGTNISLDMKNLFAKIDTLKAELNNYRPLSQTELEYLRDVFLVEYTYNSNAIEGSTMTLQETALALEGITVGEKPLKEHLEAIGHRDAFLYVESLVKDKVPLSEKVIKEIHSLVLMDRPDVKGTYRRLPVKIAGTRQELPQPFLVPKLMEELLAESAKYKRHIIEQAALFHLKFESIHPFLDGNGRTGRLIINFMLMQQGYPPIDVKFSDRVRYYNCFKVYAQNSASDSMTTLIAQYVEERLAGYLEVLKNIPANE